ncbi:uncharacterized protein LOC134228070 [Armigeres subalbatus]|uniref:uncharacterized protein LOC134228070 n=1 Tax=Armigeres subalbatus TaxID=124917 RepID=UPI002ED082C0
MNDGSKQANTRVLDEGQSSSALEITTPSARPIGQKTAKCKVRQDEVERSKIIVLEKMAATTQERNDIMRHANRIKIVTTSLDGLDEVSKQILRLEKQKILDEMLYGSNLGNPGTSDIGLITDDPQGINQDLQEIKFASDINSGASSSQKTEISRAVLEDCSFEGGYVTFDPNSLIVSDYESD